MGTLSSPHDWSASISGSTSFGFRPYWFHAGVKQYLCDEDRCILYLPHGRVSCFGLKHGDHISLVNATIETISSYGIRKWQIMVESFPSTLVGVHATKADVFKTIDLFAGLTNWSQTAKTMGLHPCVSVEKDPQIGEVGSKNLRVPAWNAEDFVKHWEHDFGKSYHHVDIMLLADVQNEQIREPMSHYRSGMPVGSPPCPPWSRLSSMMGLADLRGKLILTVADMAQFLGISIIALENVSNILHHPDFASVTEYFHHKGYALIFSGTDPLNGFLPVKRTRASLIFARYDFPVCPIPESMHLGTWDGNISAQAMGVIHGPSSEFDAIFKPLTTISEDDLQILTNPDYLTSDMMSKVSKGLTALEARAQGGRRPLPCPTARYASPDTLSEQTLIEHKLTMVVLKQGPEFRWFSPFEFAVGLGLSIHTILPVNKQLAFMMVGNTIAPLHAAINLNRALCCISSEHCSAKPVSWLVQVIARRQVPLSKCMIHFDEAVMWMTEIVQPRVMPCIVAHNDDPIEQCSEPPQHKAQDPIQIVNAGCEETNHEQPCKYRKIEQSSESSAVMTLADGETFNKTMYSYETNMRQVFDDIQHEQFMVVVVSQQMIPNHHDQVKHLITNIECKVSVKLKLTGDKDTKFSPVVAKTKNDPMFQCWFMGKHGIECHECSSTVMVGDVVGLDDHDKVILILPVRESSDQQPIDCDKRIGLWVQCGKMGDLHQLWMSINDTIGHAM